MSPFEIDDMIKKLREGKLVKCPLCHEGHMIPVGNHKTTKCFYCDKCNKKLNLN